MFDVELAKQALEGYEECRYIDIGDSYKEDEFNLILEALKIAIEAQTKG